METCWKCGNEMIIVEDLHGEKQVKDGNHYQKYKCSKCEAITELMNGWNMNLM